jgi:hypothetical protein
MSGDTIQPERLHQHWVHSREEDSDKGTVFRTSDFAFPPARGVRRALEFRTNGSVVESTNSPVDRPTGKQGTWHLAGDKIVINIQGSAPTTFTIECLESNKLVLRPEQPN